MKERLGRFIVIFVLFPLVVFSIVHSLTAPPVDPTEAAAKKAANAAIERVRQQKEQHRRYLCKLAASCQKYTDVRVECATAGSLKECIRIKMGNEAIYGDICSGFNLGAPAISSTPETPNAMECFILTHFK